jgi:pimeloyl-ACP methyl ester carboxylesterase
VLFLHGVGGGAWSWRPQREGLGADYRIFAWEARGHGSASRVDDAGLGDYYADAREALAAAAAECGGGVTLAGHSMGGLLALALAADEPDAVRGLFLIDPVYADGDSMGHLGPVAGRLARVACEPVIASFARAGRISRIISRWMFERAFEDRARMEDAWIDQRTQLPIEYPRMLREAFDGPSDFPLRDFAAEISAPTALLEGSSGLRRPRFPRLVETLRAGLAERFTYQAIPGGHYLQLDQPAAVNAALRRFLEAWSR